MKHKIRQRFHRQLKRLWGTNQNLIKSGPYEQSILSAEARPPQTIESLSHKFNMFGWNFVPLVSAEISVTCGLDVLLLRPTPRSRDSWFGDIDNRLKTLVDALGVPSPNEKYIDHAPEDAEKPFFCLFENDKLLTRLALETDEMLDLGNGLKEFDVRLIITVEIRPLVVSFDNMHFT